MLSVRPSPLFKCRKTKQQKTMFTTGVTIGVAEWIIDDTCLVQTISWKFKELTKHDTRRCENQTKATQTYFLSSMAAKVMTPQAVCIKMMAKLMAAEIMTKLRGSSPKPTVPGPRLSARTLTRLNAPDIIPKPSPTTARENIIYQVSLFYTFKCDNDY